MQAFLRAIGLPYVAERLGSAFYQSTMESGVIPDFVTALQRTYEPVSDEWVDFVQALRDIKNISDALHLPQPIFISLNQGLHSSDYENPVEGGLDPYLAWYHQAEQAAEDVGFLTYNR